MSKEETGWLAAMLKTWAKVLGVLAILGLATWGVLTLLKEERYDLREGTRARIYLVARAGSSSYGESILGRVEKVDRRGVTIWGKDPDTGRRVSDYMLVPWDSIYYVVVEGQP